MKTKVKICFATFPLILSLVLSFRSGFSLIDIFGQLGFIASDFNGFNFGFLQESIYTLVFDYFGFGYNISLVFAWYFSYLIYVGLGFLLYDLFLWFGSFIKSFK